MVSNFEVDVNCPACFHDMVAALREQADVTDVHASIASGCVTIVHDGDEAHLAAVITDTGHLLVVAGNGEIVQDRLHPVASNGCRVHR
jgi:copper chaperone CopZ